MSSEAQIMTERLVLRAWQDGDRDVFAAMNADPIVMRYFTAPFTREESDRHFERYRLQLARDGFTMYAAEDAETHDFLGIIGMQVMHTLVPSLPQPAIELGWRLTQAAQGRGLATEGARAVLARAFQFFRLPEIVAITTRTNTPSRRVMEKLGMVHQPTLDFEHLSIAVGHPFRPHVLYSIVNPELRCSDQSLIEEPCVVF